MIGDVTFLVHSFYSNIRRTKLELIETYKRQKAEQNHWKIDTKKKLDKSKE